MSSSGVVAALAFCVATATAGDAPRVHHQVFGYTKDGAAIDEFTLLNGKGAVARIITYGAILADLRIPDAHGTAVSVVTPITFSPEALSRHFPESGRIVGRVANRIANARFTLDGREYKLEANAGPHNIHAGPVGFDRVIWQGKAVDRADGAAVQLKYLSRDGDQGMPGNLDVTIVYTLTTDNVLRIEYQATTDKPTLCNITSHGFFNLAGAGDIRDHTLEVAAERYTVVDETKIPTGDLPPVAGTAFDFRKPVPLRVRGAELPSSAPRFDHNFVLRQHDPARLNFAARLRDPKSGRTMEVWTTEPGLQVFTSPLAGRIAPNTRGTICLEAQHFPDAIHHPNFPSIVLRPGAVFHSMTEYRFSNR